MSMPMLEHETQGTGLSGLTARNEVQIVAVDLDRTFLIKKMEVEFSVDPGLNLIADDASAAQFSIDQGLLVFFHEAGVATDAENALDASLEDAEKHNDIIWSNPFNMSPGSFLTDDADNVTSSQLAKDVIFKRTKSFPKGYPLDRSDSYSWKVINLSESAAFNAPATLVPNHFLRVRYWGVWI